MDAEDQGRPELVALMFLDQLGSYMKTFQNVLQLVSLYLLTHSFSLHYK